MDAGEIKASRSRGQVSPQPLTLTKVLCSTGRRHLEQSNFTSIPSSFFLKYSIYWHTVFIWRLIPAHSRPSQGKSLEDKEEQVEGLLHRERALAIGIQLLSHNASGHITEHLNIIIKNGTGDFFDAPCRGWRSNIAQRSSASVGNGTSRPLKPFFFFFI